MTALLRYSRWVRQGRPSQAPHRPWEACRCRAPGTDTGWVREGANHEVWTIGDERLVIPRHREINEYTAKGIIKKAEEVTTDGDE